MFSQNKVKSLQKHKENHRVEKICQLFSFQNKSTEAYWTSSLTIFWFIFFDLPIMMIIFSQKQICQ